MKNYANGPRILERVRFVMKNYANGLSMIIEGVLTCASPQFVMKNYASGLSILENVFCHEKLCKWA